MRLSTRLLFALLPTIVMVMLGYAAWAQWERERALASLAQRETEAYATAAGTALGPALSDLPRERAQEILEQIGRAASVYAVVVYDSAGQRSLTSDPQPSSGAAPSELREVLRSGHAVALTRVIGNERVYTVIRPLRDGRGQVIGALEVARRPSIAEAAMAGARQRLVWTTVALLAALSLAVLWVVRRRVTRPLSGLVTAARDLGRGKASCRIPAQPAGRELADLASEFNAMADSVEALREQGVEQTEERIALEGRLRESEKLAVIGNLAAGVAHEIAAPLNVIAGRVEMLRRQNLADGDRDRHLAIIGQQTSRITAIVRNLLDFARRRPPALRPVDACTILDSVDELLETEVARSGVTVRREGDAPAWIHGDPTLLNQVFVNLYLNALQAMDGQEGSRQLTVRIRDNSPEPGLVAISVADTGPGIPEQLREQLFDPFFTTKPTGSGLGLPVARGIVEGHAGRIEVRSPNGTTGTEVSVILPSAQT